MDAVNSILTEPVSEPTPLLKPDISNIENMSVEKKKQVAKDFESVLLYKLLEQMKNTVGDWGQEKDGASDQVQGIFWMCLSRKIADNGGLGLWKDIYQYLNQSENTNITENLLDNSL